MNNDRRRFLKTSLLGSAAIVAGCTTEVATEVAAKTDPFRPLRILVLGGTGFIGPHMVREALRRGHEVSLFNRGRTNNELFPDLELFTYHVTLKTPQGCSHRSCRTISIFRRFLYTVIFQNPLMRTQRSAPWMTIPWKRLRARRTAQ